MSQEDMRARIREKFVVLEAVLDERSRRLWAVTEAKARGHGGQTLVAKATGLSRRTIYQGLREFEAFARDHQEIAQRVRSPGGGRTPVTSHDPTLLAALEALVEPTSRGDPESPWRWTGKSVRQLTAELPRQGHKVGRHKVAELLADVAYSLQGHRQTKEGTAPPDRHAQFAHMHAQVAAFQKRGQPVVSVDTKKKALVGDGKHGGRAWRPAGDPELVRTSDFVDKTLGKVPPYGVYNQTANVGWVSVGVDHDTAACAVESIQRWWGKMGACREKDATAWRIPADGGGRNGSRSRLWKVALQRLADVTGLRIAVCHFPPGTSQWQKIEHRMGSHSSMHWRGQPLTSHEVLVHFIAKTTTEKGLKIQAELDPGCYPTGIKVTDEELKEVVLEPAAFHGEWHYTIMPRTARS